MEIEEGFFKTFDGENLFYRYRPGKESGIPLVICHGHGEHSGRYLKFFSRFENSPDPIGVFDLRGCGRSGGARVYVSQFEDYAEDLASFIRFLRLRLKVGEQSVNLLGHSLGGLIATLWAYGNQKQVNKLILSSPLFGIPSGRFLQKIVKLLNRFCPRLVIHNPVKPPFLTHDSEEVERYKKDALIQRSITVRLVSEMLRTADFFGRGEFHFLFPVYILMAEQDFIVDPKATWDFYSRIRAPEKELDVYPGFFHEIFNEKGQDRVFDRLHTYLNR